MALCRLPFRCLPAHWRPLRLPASLAVIGAVLSPAAAAADAALDRALFERLEMAIAGDHMPGLRSFERRQFGGLLPDRSDWWRDHLLGQLPPEAADLPPHQPVDYLELEPCGPLLSQYGLAERRDLGFDYGDIDRIRVTLALDASGLGAGLSLETMNALRDGEDRHALRALNTRLYRYFADGRTDVVPMVLDFSEGCGSEIPSSVLIKSAQKLHDISVIPDFYFSVCEGLHADPWDPASCPWWNAAPEQAMVSGVYHWQGRLRSGESRNGRIQVDLDGSDWSTRQIVLLP